MFVFLLVSSSGDYILKISFSLAICITMVKISLLYISLHLSSNLRDIKLIKLLQCHRTILIASLNNGLFLTLLRNFVMESQVGFFLVHNLRGRSTMWVLLTNLNRMFTKAADSFDLRFIHFSCSARGFLLYYCYCFRSVQ